MPQTSIDSYEIIARTHRPVPPHSQAGQAGSSNHFDIYLYKERGGRRNKLAEISFWSGDPDSWPDDSFTTANGDEYLRVNTPVETFAGVVDILRNETNRYLAWREPQEGRSWTVIRTAVEPTGEGDVTR